VEKRLIKTPEMAMRTEQRAGAMGNL